MARKTGKLTHLDPDGRPAMVDVSAKAATAREAQAACKVKFPAEVAAQLRANAMKSAKGGIVETAIVAGTMAAKRTHELIPFCHSLPIDACKLAIDWHDARTLRIECTVRVTHRTGVEMEALMAVNANLLTIYDMVKTTDHGMFISDIRLLEKRDRKSGDFVAQS